MEIERKWNVSGWPEDFGVSELKPAHIYQMEQGYIALDPTVRIRKEDLIGGKTDYILCFKGHGGLSREEIELSIDPSIYRQLKALIEKPMILKERRDYPLSNGLTLEVSHVDAGQPTSFYYAEIEYPTEEEALAWKPDSDAFSAYLSDDVTGKKGSSMGDYWRATRL